MSTGRLRDDAREGVSDLQLTGGAAAGPRAVTRRALAGLPYDEQVQMVRPVALLPPVGQLPPIAASAVQFQSEPEVGEGAVEGAQAGGTDARSEQPAAPGEPDGESTVALSQRMGTEFDALQCGYNGLNDAREAVERAALAWTRLCLTAGVAHAGAKSTFDQTLAAQERSDRASVDLLLGILRIATGGIWAYVDSLLNVSEQLSTAAAGMRVAVGLFLSDRQNAVVDAVGSIGAQIGELFVDDVDGRATKLAQDALVGEVGDSRDQTTVEFQASLLRPLIDTQLAVLAPLTVGTARIVACQELAIDDRRVLNAMTARSERATAVEVRVVEGWERLGRSVTDEVARLIETVASSSLMVEPPELAEGDLGRDLERALWADWLQRRLDAGPSVSCPDVFALEGEDVPSSGPTAGSRCEVRELRSPLGSHIDARLRELGIPLPRSVGNQAVLDWARAYQPEVRL